MSPETTNAQSTPSSLPQSALASIPAPGTPHAAPPSPGQPLAGLRRSERELVCGLVEGRPEAFEALDREYRERVRRFAVKRLRDPIEAEDVCQDVFLDVHRSIASFEGRSSFTTWIFGIAHHQVHRRFRRRGRDHVSLESQVVEEIAAERPHIEASIDAHRALADLDRALEAEVAPRHREIFQRRYRDGLPTLEIASEIGRSNQSVKISLFRTRRALEAHAPTLGAWLIAS